MLTLLLQVFIITVFAMAIIANNSFFGGKAPDPVHVSHGSAPNPFASPAAAPPMLSGSQDPNQAYIWAPIGQTPRHIKRDFFVGEATDTDASPGEPTSRLLAFPQTPNRRSPSKGERSRSPTKRNRSPSKGY